MEFKTIMYCTEFDSTTKGKMFFHFFHHPKSVKMCQDSREPHPIFKVEVSENADPNAGQNIGGPSGSYWGWWNSEDNSFHFVFPSRLQVDMCFPYGAKAEEERGRGKMMPVNVTVLEEVKP